MKRSVLSTLLIFTILLLLNTTSNVQAGQSGGGSTPVTGKNNAGSTETGVATPTNNRNNNGSNAQQGSNPVHVFYNQFNTVTISTVNVGRWSFAPSSLSFETVAELERSHLLNSSIYVHYDNQPQGLDYTAGHGRMDVYLGKQINSSVGTGGSYSGGGGSSGSGRGSARVTMIGIKLSPSSIGIYAGHTTNITVKALYSNGTSQTVPNGSAHWVSSNPGVAAVNQGTISAVSSGTATITATYNGYTQSAAVTVKAVKTTVRSRLTR